VHFGIHAGIRLVGNSVLRGTKKKAVGDIACSFVKIDTGGDIGSKYTAVHKEFGSVVSGRGPGPENGCTAAAGEVEIVLCTAKGAIVEDGLIVCSGCGNLPGAGVAIAEIAVNYMVIETGKLDAHADD
jgi:hypothetical protein